MRRSDHPSQPSAITCCRFSALKTLAIPAAGVQPTAQVNASAPGAALAGFQVSINGRFWVSTEEVTQKRPHLLRADHGGGAAAIRREVPRAAQVQPACVLAQAAQPQIGVHPVTQLSHLALLLLDARD